MASGGTAIRWLQLRRPADGCAARGGHLPARPTIERTGRTRLFSITKMHTTVTIKLKEETYSTRFIGGSSEPVSGASFKTLRRRLIMTVGGYSSD